MVQGHRPHSHAAESASKSDYRTSIGTLGQLLMADMCTEASPPPRPSHATLVSSLASLFKFLERRSQVEVGPCRGPLNQHSFNRVKMG